MKERFLYQYNDYNVTVKVWEVRYYDGTLIKVKTIHPLR
jgi:hypothetical protein